MKESVKCNISNNLIVENHVKRVYYSKEMIFVIKNHIILSIR